MSKRFPTALMMLCIVTVSSISACKSRADAEEPKPKAQAEMRIVRLDGGADRVCSIDTQAQAYCWGYNHSGTLGLGHAEKAVRQPTHSAQLSQVDDIDHGFFQTCVENDAQISCLGETNAIFQSPREARTCRDGNQLCALELTPLVDARGEIALDQIACVRHEQKPGALTCWGSNIGGLLDPGSVSVDARKPQILDFQVPSIGLFAPTIEWVCAVSPPRKLVCLAGNRQGAARSRHEHEASANIVALDAFMGGGCIATEAGDAFCWGTAGTLEDTLSITVRPDEDLFSDLVRLPLEGVEQISIGLRHACALTKPGDVYCWGANDTAQLAREPDGDGQTWHEPVRVESLPPAAQVEVIGRATCALTRDAEVYCWGNNDVGQLGIESEVGFAATPQRVEVKH